jgi:hypothetical protein
VTEAIAPKICDLVNAALSAASVPECPKTANVTPLLKKTGLEKEDLKNYRPDSNLSFVSKVLERVVDSQVRSHMTINDLLV